jgi:hypothetical protein
MEKRAPRSGARTWPGYRFRPHLAPPTLHASSGRIVRSLLGQPKVTS